MCLLGRFRVKLAGLLHKLISATRQQQLKDDVRYDFVMLSDIIMVIQFPDTPCVTGTSIMSGNREYNNNLHHHAMHFKPAAWGEAYFLNF